MKIYVVIVDDEQEFEQSAKLKTEVFFDEDDRTDRMVAYDSIGTPCTIEDFDSVDEYLKWIDKTLNTIFEDEIRDDYDD